VTPPDSREGRAAGPGAEELLRAEIDRHVAEIEPLLRACNEAVWLANTTGEARHEEESARLEAQIRTIYAHREPLERLLELQRGGQVRDPLLARQLDLLVLAYKAHQIPPATIERMVGIEKSLESRFNNFRAELSGRRVTDNELRRVLRVSDDAAERRAAWEASKQIGGEVRDELLELVRLRNEAARDQGHPNYYAMMLALDELDETELFATLDELERATRPRFAAYKRALDAGLAERFRVRPEELRPWHYADPFFQEAPPAGVDLDRCFKGQSLERLTQSFFAAIGFEIGDLLGRADLYERPGKSQHAFCMSVDRGDDIRVLCNLQPNEYWMGTMLHEFGHAVYDQCVDRTLPFLLRTHAHILTTEASAMLFGRLSRNAAWLERYAGMPADEARAAAAASAAAAADQLLVMSRWCLVMCAMERALYRDPGQDLDALWWELVERYQLVRRPDGRRAPDWASKIHFSTAPVYYHNYMLGELMASQLQRTLLGRVAGGADAWERYVSSPAVGVFLRERLYSTGRRYDWRETLRRATGEQLGVAAFVADLTPAG
jgi:peptidyl-dipeptidase A